MSVFVIVKQDSFVLSMRRVVNLFCLCLDWRALALCDKDFINVLFTCLAQCVWDLQALYKSLIQVFDFKANGDSSGGWDGGKMLHSSPLSGPCHVLIFISLFGVFFLLSSTLPMIYCLFYLNLCSHGKISILCIFHFFLLLVCLFICLIRKKNAFHFPKCLELFLRRVCHSNVTLCVLLGGSGFWPLLTFVLLTLLHGLCHHCCVA